MTKTNFLFFFSAAIFSPPSSIGIIIKTNVGFVETQLPRIVEKLRELKEPENVRICGKRAHQFTRRV